MKRIPVCSAALASIILASGSPAELGHERELLCAHAGQIEFAAPIPFDERGGGRADHFPQPRKVDIEHIRLDVNLPAIDTREVQITEILVFSAPWEEVHEVSFNAEGLEIHSVERLDDAALSVLETSADTEFEPRWGLPHFNSGSEVHVAFREPIAKGGRAALRFHYTVREPKSGLHWVEPLPGGLEKDWQLWSQGQSQNNRHWFITHDYPNERHTSELIVRTPSRYKVSGAGQLVAKNDSEGNTTWHWRMDQPHVSYLTTMAVGDFHVETEDWRGKAVEYWVPQRFANDVQATFSRTRDMLTLFSNLFDEEYPYSRYAQVVVDEYMHGGMENITASTLVNSVMQGPLADKYSRGCGENREGLIAHELGHQWFGDLITCRTWSHIWLNEGWAAYCEHLWEEHACGRDAYDYELWKRAQRIPHSDRPETLQPLVFLQAPSSEVVFGFNGSAAYNKGSYVLHMLREKLGDDAFWRGVQSYIDQHKWSTATTEDFRIALEQASGRDLEAWFRQWLHTPGTPWLRFTVDYSPMRGMAKIGISQTQKITPESPAFMGEIELFFQTSDGRTVREVVELKERSHLFEVALVSEPVVFAPDPRGAFLSGVELKMPAAMLARTAQEGPSVMARCTAIRALSDGGATAVEPLAAIVMDNTRFYGERVEAVKTLAEIDNKLARKALAEAARAAIDATPDGMDYRIRNEIASAMKVVEDEIAINLLAQMAEDPSEVVARSAVNSISYMYGEEVAEILLQAAERRGEHDQLLDVALDGFQRTGDERGVEIALRATGPDINERVRPNGVVVLGDLLEGTNPEPGSEAAERLMELLDDPQWRMKRYVIPTLGKIKYEPAILRLERIRAQSANTSRSEQAAAAINEIRDKSGTRSDVRSLSGELDKLQLRVEELQRDLARLQGTRPSYRGSEAAPEKKKRKRFLGIF